MFISKLSPTSSSASASVVVAACRHSISQAIGSTPAQGVTNPSRRYYRRLVHAVTTPSSLSMSESRTVMRMRMDETRDTVRSYTSFSSSPSHSHRHRHDDGDENHHHDEDDGNGRGNGQKKNKTKRKRAVGGAGCLFVLLAGVVVAGE